MKYRQDDNHWSDKTLSAKAGLQFCVEHVAFIASRLTNKVPFTVDAAIYLTAVVEYMIAELLELSGNAAKDLSTTILSPRHIMLAITGDEELDTYYKNVLVVDGGLIPHILKSVLRGVRDPESDFEQRLIRKAREAATSDHPVFIGNAFSSPSPSPPPPHPPLPPSHSH